MKKCQICGKSASVFLTRIVDGELTKLALCEECARREGFFDPERLETLGPLIPKELSEKIEEIVRELISQDDVLSEFMNRAISDEDDSRERTRNGKIRSSSACPNCGYTPAMYKATHRLGCSVCYEHFESLLNRILPPNRRKEETDTNEEVNEQMLKEYLENELKKAVKNELYEKAAHFRDCIRQLKEDV